MGENKLMIFFSKEKTQSPYLCYRKQACFALREDAMVIDGWDPASPEYSSYPICHVLPKGLTFGILSRNTQLLRAAQTPTYLEIS